MTRLLKSFALAMLCVLGAFAQNGDVPPLAPLSSMVAVTSRTPIPDRVAALVDAWAKGSISEYGTFPLNNTISDSVRVHRDFRYNVVARWLQPLTEDKSVGAPRFGANADFIAFFGDNWDADWENDVVGSGPMMSGDSTKGWIWANHEYISNSYPTTTSAPNGQHMTYARFLESHGELSNVSSDTWSQEQVDKYIRWHKRQVGGSWFRVVKNRYGKWYVDTTAEAVRYDASSDTLATVEGYDLMRTGHDDLGNELPQGVAAGIMGDCSGGQTPWGTILTAEENVQGFYGDFETCWTSSNRFVQGQGFDPGSVITFNPEPGNTDGQIFGRTSNPNERHDRDHYGFLVEIDPGVAANDYYVSVNKNGDGVGHRKIGTMGRVRWENATVAMDSNFNMIDGQPVVIYGGNDRRSGRVYKFVSSGTYTKGMTRGEVRALLDEGKVYAAHFAGLNAATGVDMYNPENPDSPIVPTEENRGQGQWIWMSTENQTQVAPNAAALGTPNMTVGDALKDVNWNGIGGFASENQVLGALFTAANKLGISEMNRPEDLEYNPKDISGTPRLYCAFTNHTRPSANNQDGVMDSETPSRQDGDGSIFAVEEANAANPAASNTFSYFRVWRGYRPDAVTDNAQFATSDPDNLAIDKNGNVWFGTDGNAGSTGDTRADGIYFLDLDPAHKEGVEGVTRPSYGKAFRVVASPGDAEATGPWFTPDGTTLFFNVQHPGEDTNATPSTWPQDREPIVPRGDIFDFKNENNRRAAQ